jgi:stalled ribosome rescue protein Dom34
MKKTGIWLDKEKAHIVTLEKGNETIKTLLSAIETYRIHGGSGTRLKGGPQDVVKDSRYLEREKHQYKVYFKNIVEEIRDKDVIVIFGPAEAKEKLGKELSIHYKQEFAKVKDIVTADSMTDNQIMAWVRKYYS